MQPSFKGIFGKPPMWADNGRLGGGFPPASRLHGSYHSLVAAILTQLTAHGAARAFMALGNRQPPQTVGLAKVARDTAAMIKRFAFTLKHHVSRNALKSKISGSVR